jgi:hypothetical protein
MKKHLNIKPGTHPTDTICWKLYLKELFLAKKINEKDLKRIYTLDFRFDKLTSNKDLIIGDMIMELMERDIKDGENTTFKKIIREDVDFILDGKIKPNFELEWKFYLFECLHYKFIDNKKYTEYKKSIDFKKPMEEKDYNKIKEILNLLRIRLVSKFPETITYIEKPSFEVLMAANNMDYK